MKFLRNFFKKSGSKETVARQLSIQEHNELVGLCEKALKTKKLTISKSSAIRQWFDDDFNRALDPVASELFCHCCDVEQYGEISLNQSMRDCIDHIVDTRDDPTPRSIPESTNEFAPFQEIRIKYSNKNGDLSDRHIIFIKSEVRPIKKLKTDITAICLTSKYALNFVKERIVSHDLIDDD